MSPRIIAREATWGYRRAVSPGAYSARRHNHVEGGWRPCLDVNGPDLDERQALGCGRPGDRAFTAIQRDGGHTPAGGAKVQPNGAQGGGGLHGESRDSP